jgi:hypothetical protein
MKRTGCALIVVFLFGSAFAVQNPYLDGTIVDVQKRVNTRVLYYIVNTPVTRDDPYYEIRVNVQGTVYTAQYTPRHADDTFLDEYASETKIQAKVEKRHLFLKQHSGNDLDLIIVKRGSAEKGKGTADAIPAKQ